MTGRLKDCLCYRPTVKDCLCYRPTEGLFVNDIYLCMVVWLVWCVWL